MAKKPISAQKRADRALCPVEVSHLVQMKVREVARAMRAAGVTGALTREKARAWKKDPADAPEWFTALLAERAARDAAREHRDQQADIEDQHRLLLAEETVVQRLLAGAQDFRTPEEELIATDMAFRASKELCRAHTDTCGDFDPGPFTEVDFAALRWAGVDPFDHSTWAVHRGDCPE